jgi:hypothetical protein
LLPDLLLMAEVSLLGGVKQISRELWRRRPAGLFSLARQRTSLFVQQPWHVRLRLPITWVHTVMLLWLHVISPKAGTSQQRKDGLRLAGQYLWFISIARLRRIGNRTKQKLSDKPGYQFAKRIHHRLRRAA